MTGTATPATTTTSAAGTHASFVDSRGSVSPPPSMKITGRRGWWSLRLATGIAPLVVLITLLAVAVASNVEPSRSPAMPELRLRAMALALRAGNPVTGSAPGRIALR